MAQILKKFDLFGIKHNPKIDSKENYQTCYGLFFTIVFVSIAIFVTYLFSRDFIEKTNPKVLYSDVFSKDLKIFEIDNSNFFLAWTTLTDSGAALKEDETFQYPYISYVQLGNIKDDLYYNEYIIAPKPCKEVLSADKYKSNNIFELSQCFDLKAVKEQLGKEVTFYGNFDSVKNAFFYFEFSNCKYNMERSEFEHCLSLDEILKRNNKNMFFSLIFPKVDVEINNYEEPISNGLADVMFSVSPFSKIYERMTFTNLVLEDDTGWINENIDRKEFITFKANKTNFGVNLPENFNNNKKVVFYQFDMLFSMSETHYKRIYVKIQEIAANLGGILKVFLFFFHIVSRFFTSVDFDNYLISRFSKKIKINQNRNNSSVEELRAGTFKVDEDEVKLKGIFYGRFYKRDEFREYNNTLNTIKKKIDVLSLIDSMFELDKLIQDLNECNINSPASVHNSNTIIRLRNNVS